MGERVDRGVGRREDEEVVGHGVGWLVEREGESINSHKQR